MTSRSPGRPLTVALLSHSWATTTGAGRCAVELRDLLSAHPDVRLVTEASTPEGDTAASKAVSRILRGIRIARLLRREGVDVVVVNTSVQSSVVIASWLVGTRVVWWCHESGASLEGRLMRLRIAVYARLCVALVTVSRDHPVTQLHATRVRNIVTPGDTTRAEGPSRLLVMGRKGRIKGTDLLAALVDPLALPPDTQLAVIGDVEPREADLVEYARRHLQSRWNARLDWRPATEAPALEYRRADVLLLPSRTEARARVVEEALAHGVPVVAHDLSGLHDIAETVLEPGALTLLSLDADWTTAVAAVLAEPPPRVCLVSPWSAEDFLGAWLQVLGSVADDD